MREKAKAKAATEAMRALIAQKAGQSEKPKPKVCGMELFSSYFFTNLFFQLLATSGGQSVCTW